MPSRGIVEMPKQAAQHMVNVKTKVFISYSHKNGEWLEEFRKMLSPKIGDQLEIWTDNRIEPSMRWEAEIESALASATAALLLVTDDFMDSPYIRNVELPAILRRRDEGLKVYWVKITPAFTDSLAGIQAACNPCNPLIEMDEALRKTTIHDVCAKLVSDAGRSIRLRPSQRDRLTREVEAVIRRWNISLQNVIGGGSVAVIYRGLMEGRQVVVKALIDSPLRGRRDELLKDIEHVSQLRHPCFSRLEHVALDEDPQCVILEYVAAPTVDVSDVG